MRESEERLRAIIDNSPASIALKDPDGRFILIGKRTEENYG
ncbi:MAG: PAS domain S-box protein, partial [Nitrospinota bacterium]|nr:PAS domain S-box protein [Nitrospinota bacterium]